MSVAGLFDPEDEDTRIFRNVNTCLPLDRT